MKTLLRVRPHGWSVVRSGELLSVRPPDRARGKFTLGFHPDGRVWVARFDRVLNRWTRFEYIEPTAIAADNIFEHLERRIGRDG